MPASARQGHVRALGIITTDWAAFLEQLQSRAMQLITTCLPQIPLILWLFLSDRVFSSCVFVGSSLNRHASFS